MASCSTNETCADLGTCPNFNSERTDIQITGQLDIWDNQIIENGLIEPGPIELIYHGDPSDRFDFTIALESGYSLDIHMVNKSTPNPWEQVDVSYTAYPGHDLSTKLRYVSAELRYGNDAPIYSTNLSGTTNPEVIRGAFYITSNAGGQIRARIRELKLYHNIDSQKKIEINGTFAAVDDHTEQ
jgi:hypothetical protein